MCFLNALTPGSSLIQKSDLSFSKQTWNGKKFVSSQFQVKWKWDDVCVLRRLEGKKMQET